MVGEQCDPFRGFNIERLGGNPPVAAVKTFVPESILGDKDDV